MGNKSFIKNNMNISELLTNFAKEHTIFHSEADFQFKFAWFLKEKHNFNPILEKPFAVENLELINTRSGETYTQNRIEVDIVVDNIAI